MPQGYTRPTAAINNEYSGAERDELYNAGGVIAVTSRILAVDFLTDRVPADKVTGLVVWDAHRVSETSSEAFILRLFRQKNKVGFIKGISDSADSFSAGFFKVEKVMKSLFVKKLFLWPRFHVTVTECLNENGIDLVELKQASGDASLRPTIPLEPLGGGGLFKRVRAPQNPGDQSWAVMLVHPDGVVTATQQVKVVADASELARY